MMVSVKGIVTKVMVFMVVNVRKTILVIKRMLVAMVIVINIKKNIKESPIWTEG